MTGNDLIKFVRKLGREPCIDGETFACSCATAAQTWATCPRADWMYWFLDAVGYRWAPGEERLLACDHAAAVAHLGDEPLLLGVIEVARRYALGDANYAELAVAAWEAWEAVAERASWGAAAASHADILRAAMPWSRVIERSALRPTCRQRMPATRRPSKSVRGAAQTSARTGGIVKPLHDPVPPPWRPAAERVEADEWRRMKDEFRAEKARRDAARRGE